MEIHRKLVYKGSKLEVFLIYFLIIPFLFRTEYIIKFWLGDVPEHLIFLARWIVFVSLVVSAMEPIKTAVLASNRIIQYLIIPDSLFLLVLPVSYFVGYSFEKPEWMLIVIISLDIVCCFLRIYIGIKVTLLDLVEYLKQVVMPCIYVALPSFICCYLLSIYFKENIIGMIALFFCNAILLSPFIYLLGLNIGERKVVRQMLHRIFYIYFNNK